MKETETLSSKIIKCEGGVTQFSPLLYSEDVKEFIRKESILLHKLDRGEISFLTFIRKRNELVGKDLI